MSTVITFPRPKRDGKPRASSFFARSTSMLVRIVWVLTVMVWPIFRWVLVFDLTAQLFRMLIIFADKGAYFDWTFMVHFLVVVAIFCFVECYRS